MASAGEREFILKVGALIFCMYVQLQRVKPLAACMIKFCIKIIAHFLLSFSSTFYATVNDNRLCIHIRMYHVTKQQKHNVKSTCL